MWNIPLWIFLQLTVIGSIAPQSSSSATFRPNLCRAAFAANRIALTIDFFSEAVVHVDACSITDVAVVVRHTEVIRVGGKNLRAVVDVPEEEKISHQVGGLEGRMSAPPVGDQCVWPRLERLRMEMKVTGTRFREGLPSPERTTLQHRRFCLPVLCLRQRLSGADGSRLLLLVDQASKRGPDDGRPVR